MLDLAPYVQEAENLKLEILRRKLAIAIGQAERREFATRDVMEIAAAVLAEEDGSTLTSERQGIEIAKVIDRDLKP
jgi:hypothetical protein